MKRGDRIAIWLPNCPQWVELALAAKRVGAMVIAINTRFRSRVQDILTRSDRRCGFYARPANLGRETDLGFEYLSRRGDALRLGGFLVHPREIESFLETLDGVEASQVVEHEGRANGERVQRAELRRLAAVSVD